MPSKASAGDLMLQSRGRRRSHQQVDVRSKLLVELVEEDLEEFQRFVQLATGKVECDSDVHDLAPPVDDFLEPPAGKGS